MKHLVIGRHLKTPNFLAFHWSPRGSLVSIGQHFIATRVVYLPKSTETSLITELDQSGPNHQLLQLCTASTAWSDSDQAVRAVHSCNSWFWFVSMILVPRNLASEVTRHISISANSPKASLYNIYSDIRQGVGGWMGKGWEYYSHPISTQPPTC